MLVWLLKMIGIVVPGNMLTLEIASLPCFHIFLRPFVPGLIAMHMIIPRDSGLVGLHGMSSPFVLPNDVGSLICVLVLF